MRKFFLFTSMMVVLLLFIQTVSAQTRIIGGIVTNSKGEPVPLASVLEKGTSNGVVSADNGRFTIKVSAATSILVISSTGYKTLEINVGASSSYDVQLEESGVLTEVVVTTAFGVKQRKKTLGYSIQEVSAEKLTQGRENNFINGIQGKVSGVIINSSGGAPGAGTDILIRGISSLNPGGNNQPLIIIDGMPVNNNTITGGVMPSSGSNNNQAASKDQFAFANRGLDINPDDIESISVLKGAGATALYGLQAANGVLIITTKKGSAGKMKVGFSSSTSIDFITKYPEVQTKFREGQQGRLSFNSDGSPNRFQSFGPLRTSADPVFYNFRDAFDKGNRINHALTIQGGNAKTTYYSSVSALNQKGIIPASKFNRYTFKLSATSQLSEKLNINASATLTSSQNTSPSAGDKGFMTALSYYSPTFDVRDYLNADGSMKVFSPGIIDNPIYVGKYSQLKNNLFRIVSNMGFTYNIIPRLKFDYKIGGDFYGDSRSRIVPGPRFAGDPTTLDLANATGGFMVEERITYRDINSNAILSWQDNISSDIDYTLMIGNTMQQTFTDILNARGEKFALPGFYDLSNTSNLYNSRFTSKRRYAGVFGSVKFAYKNALFLEITGRNDWSSTLPVENNSFFYPAASLSYVFTDLHNISSNVLNFGKLRLSYAQVGKDASPYSNGPYFSAAPGFPFNSISGFLRSTDYADPKLKPEMQKSFEAGIELHFLQDKLNLDVSYYNSKNVDQIIPVPIAYTSGYASFITNAGSIQNKGVEIELNATAFKTKDFTWNIIGNWFMNRSKVVAIKEGINEIVFYDEGRISNKLVVGGSAGDLYGTSYKRNDNGQLLIRADGFPDFTPTFVKAGNAFPDWIGSLNNSITYKGFTLSALLEYKKGGDAFDVTMRNSIRNGVLKITENRYEQMIFNGVKIADGKPNDIPVILDHNFYRNTNFFNNITDVILQDASWLRLRNVSLSYNLPKKMLDKLKAVKNINIGVTATNFILWTPYSGYDPGSNAYGAGYNVYGYTGSNIPSYSSVIFNLNVNF